MRSIHPAISPKPRSNVAEARIQPAVELSLVLPTQPAQVTSPRAKHNRQILGMMLYVCVFVVVFAIYVLSPAVATLVGTGGAAWNPQGP
ncbi:MAG TPA: hypothetical protein VFD07_04270 [Candidatus Krumholzibacteria bacterium]|nr:hypothetical protein [Candidatus Krumholzibacteria bacterium]